MLINYLDVADEFDHEVIEHFDRVSYDPIKKILRATRDQRIGDSDLFDCISRIFEFGSVTVRSDNNKVIKTYELNDTTCHDCKTSKKHQHELITEA
jgi:hypothetical protein